MLVLCSTAPSCYGGATVPRIAREPPPECGEAGIVRGQTHERGCPRWMTALLRIGAARSPHARTIGPRSTVAALVGSNLSL
jgi:hypothetical protein